MGSGWPGTTFKYIIQNYDFEGTMMNKTKDTGLTTDAHLPYKPKPQRVAWPGCSHFDY